MAFKKIFPPNTISITVTSGVDGRGDMKKEERLNNFVDSNEQVIRFIFSYPLITDNL